MRNTGPAERLAARLTRTPSGCHEWQGYRNPAGYGQIGVGGRLMLTHRLAWELANGAVPEGMCVSQRCDNHACCNAEHLTLRPKNSPKRTCEVEGCERTDIQAQGWCQMHYYRWHRNGSPGEGARRLREAKGTCRMPDCERTDAGPGQLCAVHVSRLRRTGDPAKVIAPHERAVRTGEDHQGWTGDAATYGAVHQRVKAAHGSAKSHPCALCGTTVAAHWAYDHLDPDEKSSEQGSYSTNLIHYVPMCVPCHKQHDLAVIQEGS